MTSNADIKSWMKTLAVKSNYDKLILWVPWEEFEDIIFVWNRCYGFAQYKKKIIFGWHKDQLKFQKCWQDKIFLKLLPNIKTIQELLQIVCYQVCYSVLDT